jgi:hypothetical protein
VRVHNPSTTALSGASVHSINQALDLLTTGAERVLWGSRNGLAVYITLAPPEAAARFRSSDWCQHPRCKRWVRGGRCPIHAPAVLRGGARRRPRAAAAPKRQAARQARKRPLRTKRGAK